MKYLCSFLITTSLLVTSAQDKPTKECVYEEIINLGIKHPEIVLKQVLHETGHFASYNCRVRHNLLGITNGRGKYLWFDNWRESIQWYKNWQDKWYDGCRPYYSFLECVFKNYDGSCARYAEDLKYVQKLKQIKL